MRARHIDAIVRGTGSSHTETIVSAAHDIGARSEPQRHRGAVRIRLRSPGDSNRLRASEYEFESLSGLSLVTGNTDSYASEQAN